MWRKILGTGRNREGNIIALILLMIMALITVVIFGPLPGDLDRASLFLVLGSLLNLTLGFLFGSAGRE
ncbi:hypothetical protein CHELA1G11_12862 [Hyphomicrobiales bacterium]|nr:hypothetical protein CHELA1G2_11447 [Hyphomicrobiales bacterium]CAH1667640.1 hypothetical protein CHELA1G11_12862 [Hyphomicrobiales bacterium]